MNDDRFVSYAQNLEDVMLWRALSGAVQGAGFYIDVGAADPTALSVTRAFYDRGWRGLNVEALPEQAALLRRARPRDVVAAVALSDTEGGTAPFHRVTLAGQTGLSTMDAAAARHQEAAGAEVAVLDVPVTTLAALCRAHVDGPVHFLKIDVEGAEARVLAGADFAACRPWIVVVEATEPLEAAPVETPWEPALLAAGYRHVWFDGLNRFYLADEHAALARHFATPPNVFDRFVLYDAPLQDYVASTEAVAQSRLAEITSLEAEIARLTEQLNERAAEVRPEPAPEPPPPPPPDIPPAQPAPQAGPAPASTPRPAGPGRRIAWLAYRLVRPVVRPIAWRTRQFLIGPIQAELDGHRIRLDQLIARPVPSPGHATQAAAMAGADPAFGAAMERLMLTLALENGRRPQVPPLPAGPPSPTP